MMDLSVVFQNESVSKFLEEYMKIKKPQKMKNINYFIAQSISSLTASKRISTRFSLDINETMIFNPYPKIHFFKISHVPFINPSSYILEDYLRLGMNLSSSLTNSFYDHSSLSSYPSKMMSSSVFFRSEALNQKSNINDVIKIVKNEHCFVDWAPTGYY